MSEIMTIPVPLLRGRTAIIICPRDVTVEDLGIIKLYISKLLAEIHYKQDPSKENIDKLHRLNMEILKLNDISKDLLF